MKDTLASLLIALGLLTLISPAPHPARQAKAQSLVDRSQPLSGPGVFFRVNEYRADNDLSTLETSEHTCYVAQLRSEEIATDWSHDGFWKYTKGKSSMGENLAKGFVTDQALLEGWINSPVHKAILDNKTYDHGCVRCTDGFCALSAEDIF